MLHSLRAFTGQITWPLSSVWPTRHCSFQNDPCLPFSLLRTNSFSTIPFPTLVCLIIVQFGVYTSLAISHSWKESIAKIHKFLNNYSSDYWLLLTTLNLFLISLWLELSDILSFKFHYFHGVVKLWNKSPSLIWPNLPDISWALWKSFYCSITRTVSFLIDRVPPCNDLSFTN